MSPPDLNADFPWKDSTSSNPIDDLRAYARLVEEEHGFTPTTTILSPQMYELYKRWQVWSEWTRELLDKTPRYKYFTRRVLETQLYGYPTSTSFKRWITHQFNTIVDFVDDALSL